MTAAERYRRFLLLFRVSFVLTFGAITLFMYGFVLELRKTLGPGETHPSMFTMMMGAEQGAETGPLAPGAEPRRPVAAASQQDTAPSDSNAVSGPVEPESAGGPSFYAPRQGKPRSREERDGRMTADKFLAGLQRGDPRILPYAYLMLGLMLTIVFGLTSTGLFVAQDYAGETLDREREEARRQAERTAA